MYALARFWEPSVLADAIRSRFLGVGESHHSSGAAYVYDLDSTLDFPCPMDEYLWKTFRPNIVMDQHFARSGPITRRCWKADRVLITRLYPF